jgi:hypothetical protein
LAADIHLAEGQWLTEQLNVVNNNNNNIPDNYFVLIATVTIRKHSLVFKHTCGVRVI